MSTLPAGLRTWTRNKKYNERQATNRALRPPMVPGQINDTLFHVAATISRIVRETVPWDVASKHLLSSYRPAFDPRPAIDLFVETVARCCTRRNRVLFLSRRSNWEEAPNGGVVLGDEVDVSVNTMKSDTMPLPVVFRSLKLRNCVLREN